MITDFEHLSIEKARQISELYKEEMTDIEREANVIAILDDCDIETVMNLPLSKYKTKAQALSFLLENPKPNKLPDKIILQGIEFKILKDVTKMTAGQYIDINTYIKNHLDIEYILSCILVTDVECDKPKIIRENLSIGLANSICDFFSNALRNSIKTTQIYLDMMMKRIKRKADKETKMKMEQTRKDLMRMADLVINGLG